MTDPITNLDALLRSELIRLTEPLHPPPGPEAIRSRWNWVVVPVVLFPILVVAFLALILLRQPGAPAGPVLPSVSKPLVPLAIQIIDGSGGRYKVALFDGEGHMVAASPWAMRPSAEYAFGNDWDSLPYVSASDFRVFYMDGDQKVRYLDVDGSNGLALGVEGSPSKQISFSVSPDENRVAVAETSLPWRASGSHLYIEDVATGARHDLAAQRGVPLWPIGWHSGQLVVRDMVAPLPPESNSESQGAPVSPPPRFALIDPTTGVMLAQLCAPNAPTGRLTRTGMICWVGQERGVTDWRGQFKPFGSTSDGLICTALSPAAHLMACDSNTLLQSPPPTASPGTRYTVLALVGLGGQLRLTQISTYEPIEWLDENDLVFASQKGIYTSYYNVLDIRSLRVSPLAGTPSGVVPGSLG